MKLFSIQNVSTGLYPVIWYSTCDGVFYEIFPWPECNDWNKLFLFISYTLYRKCNANEKKAKALGLECPKKELITANQWTGFRLHLGKSQPRTLILKSFSQSAARIYMMSHHMSKPGETFPCPSDFHDTLLAPLPILFL